MGQTLEQCRQDEAGKFCRSGTICREIDAMIAARAVVLSVFFPLARGLLNTRRD
jgi:hypothetical protein